jgi:hypothetical protein
MENPEWPTIVYRVFGVTNFLVVMVGGFFMASFIPSVVSGAVGNSAKDPYFLQFYWPMAAMNVCVLGSLVLGGIYLLKLKNIGVTICNVVFIAEIVYFFGTAVFWMWPFSRAINMSAASATGVGDFGLSPQLIFGYPLIPLVGLNLARWRRGKARRLQASESPSGS